jgi:signal peptidase II
MWMMGSSPTPPPTPPTLPPTLAAGGGDDRAPAERRPERHKTVAWLRATLVLVCVIVIDQLSKRAIEHSIVPGEEHKFLPGVELVNTRNHGVAFGFLPGNHVGVTILISLALLALLVYFALHAAQPLVWLPTGMLIGGALGNILDRVRHGSVTDFIKFPLGWPPFNLADTSITLGILILFVLIDRSRHAKP